MPQVPPGQKPPVCVRCLHLQSAAARASGSSPSSASFQRLVPPLYSTACLAGAAIVRKELSCKGSASSRSRCLLAALLLPVLARARAADAIPPERSPFQVELQTRRHVLALVPSRAARHFGLQVLGRRIGNGPIRRPRSARSATASPRSACRFPTWPPRRPARSHCTRPRCITYDLTVRHSATQPDVMGGGLEFVLDMKSPYFNGPEAARFGAAPR